MLQRVAYSLYWMSRYLQRADCYAKLLAAQIDLNEKKQVKIKQQWHQILVSMADDSFFYEKHQEANLETVLQFMTFDVENQNSIFSVIKTARSNASSIRETIRQEIWELINVFYLKAQSFQAMPIKGIAVYRLFFEDINVFYAQFLMKIENEITKNEALLFIKLGSSIEQSDKTSRVLDLRFFYPISTDKDINEAIFNSIKTSADYLKFNDTSDLLYYIILDENNEFSLKSVINKSEKLLSEISENIDNQTYNSIECLKNEINCFNFELFSKANLSKFIDDFQIKNNALDQAIFEQYFIFKPTHFGLNIGEQ